MNFNQEQLNIIELARPIYDGFIKTQTINMGQREISDLRAVYAETFGLNGKYPDWSGGCVDCVIKCMALIYEAVDSSSKKLKAEKASLADDEQPTTKPAKKTAAKK